MGAPATDPPTQKLSAVERAHSLNVDPANGLSPAEVASRVKQYGRNEVPEKKAHPLRTFARKFWGLSAWMLELIAVLSLILHKRTDFWIAVALLLVNAFLSFMQEERASKAVAALRHQLEVTARALRSSVWTSLGARELVPGDIVRVRAGDFVPADAQVLDGELRVDQSALTGESRELARTRDELLYSGSVVRRGEATAVVVATGTRTLHGRTTELVDTAHPKLHIEEVIARVVRWLFLIVGVLVAISVALSLVRGVHLIEILPLSLVLLMSAVPVALPVMFTVTMAVGSVELSRRGVLVTRLSAAEDAANLDVLCADKTGTLTANRLTLTGVVPQPGFTEEDVMRDGALASQEADRDPIDLAFLEAARGRHLLDGATKVVSFQPFSPDTRRTEALLETAGGQTRVYKGAMRTLAALAGLDETAQKALEAQTNQAASGGERVIAVARATAGGTPRLVGFALLADPPRGDSRELIAELRSLGIAVKMLTGDALSVAQSIARQLGLADIVRAPELRAGEAQATALAQGHDGFAEVYPEDKFLVVKSLQSAGHIVGMTGDGVNDAPALRQAEVGIAVTGATDVAKGAASVVLTREGLGGIVDLVRNGRAIYQRVLTWIINKVSRTILKAGFVVFAFVATGRFVISALAMVLLVFMTDFVKIALSTDRVRGSQHPETWNIGPQVRVGVILGVLMLAEALGMLAFGWRRLGLAQAPAGVLETFSFQLLLYFALFSLVSIRERRAFWASWPSAVLALGLTGDALAGLAIGHFGMAELRPVAASHTALIFGYAALCSLALNDVVKTALIRRSLRRVKRDRASAAG